MSGHALLEALTVTAELTGTQLSDIAKAAMVEDLLRYPIEAVIAALSRCRRELSGRLTLAAVIERIEVADGRLSANEAWALAIKATDERETVVWTDEVCEAWAAAKPILDAGDEVGARMAFRDAYDRITATRRAMGTPPKWAVSLGWDVEARAAAITDAVQLGRLASDVAQRFLPAPSDVGPVVGALAAPLLRLSGGGQASPGDHENACRLSALMAKLRAEEDERRALRERDRLAAKIVEEERRAELLAQVEALQERRA